MSDHVSGGVLGAALAVTAAAGSLALGVAPHRSGLLVFLLAVLVATRWWGRTAGRAATLAGVGIAFGVLLGSGGSWIDVAAVVLLAAGSAGIASWTDPRSPAGGEPRIDPQRVKQEFLATVSHELRTPLNAILGWTELLRRPGGQAPQQVDRGLEVIERNARRQLALVEELLAVAAPAAGPDHWARVDIGASLRGLTDEFRPTAGVAGVTFEEEPAAAADAVPVWVRGHAPSLTLALRQVIDNAIKFTPPGGRVLSRVREAGDRVLIFVTDTGAGVEPRRLDAVFEPFWQADLSTSRSHGGLGLGLTIARKLVEQHGGHLDLGSEGSGGGATVLVTLPADRG